MGIIPIDTENPITSGAIEVWGKGGQLSILQEECAELIAAVAHHNRNRTGTDQIAEEIADVVVSMMSVIKVLNIENEVKDHMAYKLTRLAGRIDGINYQARIANGDNTSTETGDSSPVGHNQDGQGTERS